MSGSLVQLVSQGVQDVYLKDDTLSNSLFTTKYNKHTNFAQEPRRLDLIGVVAPGGTSEVKITKQGDLINHVWIEGNDVLDRLPGTTFELYIGGKLVDTHTYEYLADIWNVYLAETSTKATVINNIASSSDKNFFPLHFFFCDNGMFLPLVSIPYHEVSIRIKWGNLISGTPKIYANYIFLDKDERVSFTGDRSMDILVTQVQKEDFHISDGNRKVDISTFNHPVKCIFWGHKTASATVSQDYFTFDSMSLLLNGKTKIDEMSPNYFHTTQGYYHTNHGNINFVNTDKSPFYTRFFMYSFAQNVSEYGPSGSCNFSRMDTASMNFTNISRAPERSGETLQVYTLNYNILRIRSGLAGILFSN